MSSSTKFRAKMKSKYGSLFTKHHSMMMRCYNKTNSNYKYYGGKGIEICEEWKDLDGFYEWAMKNGFKEGLQIDRIDASGNYEPSNCRFVTQTQNKRRRSLVKMDMAKAEKVRDIYKTNKRISEIAILFCVSRKTIWSIVNNKTWRKEDV